MIAHLMHVNTEQTTIVQVKLFPDYLSNQDMMQEKNNGFKALFNTKTLCISL